MRNIITTLVIMVISLSVFGQTPFQKTAISPSRVPAGMKAIDKAQVDALKGNRMPANSGSRAVQQIIVDYDAVDEIVTVDENKVYERFIWDLNSNYDENDTNRFALSWGVVAVDTLYDANNLVGYPRSSTPVTVDSIQLLVTHENTEGTFDTVEVSVYAWQGALGLQVNGQEVIVNTVLYDTLIITNTSLTPGPAQLGMLTIYPDLQLTYPNNRFLVGIHFYGDTANHTFTVLAGYGDRCGGACFAYPSVFELNSLWRMIAWAGQTNLTGINGIAYNCNGNGVVGEPEECEEFPIQNFAFTAYLTIDPALTSEITASDNSICPGETVSLSVNPIGGTGPYTVSWEPQSAGLTNPFSPTTSATPLSTTDYIATIIDATPDTITKTIRVSVNAISVSINDLDLSIGCGQTTNLDSVIVGGTVTGATFAWSNSVNTLTNPNLGSGTYTISATNSFGCSATDAVTVTIPGVNQVLNFSSGLVNNIGCQDVPINFTNTSKNTTNWDWNWTFGDNSGNISTAESPSYTYTATGPYVVTLSADSLGCSVSSVSKTVTINICIGIEESWLSSHVEMYPNPTRGLVTLNFKDIDSKTGVVGIYDVTGKLAVEEQISVAGNAQKVMDLTSLADGVYFVKIQLGDGVMMRKLNVTR